MFSPEKKEEMRARLRATLKPKPAPPTPAQRAEERFSEEKQPVEAIVARYVDATKPLANRLNDNRVAIAQAQLDRAMEAHRSIHQAFQHRYRSSHKARMTPTRAFI